MFHTFFSGVLDVWIFKLHIQHYNVKTREQNHFKNHLKIGSRTILKIGSILFQIYLFYLLFTSSFSLSSDAIYACFVLKNIEFCCLHINL